MRIPFTCIDYEVLTLASSSETSTNHLFLALDYATSIPVRLKDVYPPASQLESLTSQPNNNPPGKFYKSEHALPVLQAFRTEGSTARLILDPGADELHRAHFARFCSRLHAGELVSFRWCWVLSIISRRPPSSSR